GPGGPVGQKGSVWCEDEADVGVRWTAEKKKKGFPDPGIEPGRGALAAPLLLGAPSKHRRASFCHTPSRACKHSCVPARPPSAAPGSAKGQPAALAGNRTRVNCLEGSYAHHYTTNAARPGQRPQAGGTARRRRPPAWLPRRQKAPAQPSPAQSPAAPLRRPSAAAVLLPTEPSAPRCGVGPGAGPSDAAATARQPEGRSSLTRSPPTLSCPCRPHGAHSHKDFGWRGPGLAWPGRAQQGGQGRSSGATTWQARYQVAVGGGRKKGTPLEGERLGRRPRAGGQKGRLPPRRGIEPRSPAPLSRALVRPALPSLVRLPTASIWHVRDTRSHNKALWTKARRADPVRSLTSSCTRLPPSQPGAPCPAASDAGIEPPRREEGKTRGLASAARGGGEEGVAACTPQRAAETDLACPPPLAHPRRGTVPGVRAGSQPGERPRAQARRQDGRAV
uniref:Uncharacterized protein LOC109677280 n=1 Tax=Castor canadensis TaxID=51338 RepID=A0A8B7TPP6_CASCN